MPFFSASAIHPPYRRPVVRPVCDAARSIEEPDGADAEDAADHDRRLSGAGARQRQRFSAPSRAVGTTSPAMVALDVQHA
jgi:hypothetical protein